MSSNINTFLPFCKGAVARMLLLALVLVCVSCSNSRDYQYVYLREVVVDGFDADDELFDEAAEQLAASGLTVITDRAEARSLTPSQKLVTLKVAIDITQKRRNVEADIDIENYSSNRELFDAEYKCPRSDDNPDASVSQSMRGAIDKALDWITR